MIKNARNGIKYPSGLTQRSTIGISATHLRTLIQWYRGKEGNRIMGATSPLASPGKEVQTKRLVREVVLYAGTSIVALLLACWILRVNRADMRIPFLLPGDGIYYGALVKIMIETGWVHHHPDLGAPFGLDLYDFAHFDNVQLGLMKLLTVVSTHWGTVINLYFLLTFPLTAVTTLILFRSLGMPAVLSACMAILYAVQPYHFMRGQGHIMLSSYFLLPLLTLVCLWLFEVRSLNTRDPGGLGDLLRSKRFWFALLVCFLGASSGHYYSCFACLFFISAGLCGVVINQSWKQLRQAFLLCGVIFIGFVLNLLPNIIYWAEHGSNRAVSAKPLPFSEIYGLKLIQVLLPIPDHRLWLFRHFSEKYIAHSPLINENTSSAVGIIASIGCVLLVLRVILPLPQRETLLRKLGVLTIVAILFATIGGVGTIIAYLINPQLHGLNRISIYLALFGLIAIASQVHSVCLRIANPTMQHAALSIISSALLVVGVFDQTSHSFIPKYRDNQEAYLRNETYGRTIQAMVAPGTKVFQLPCSGFPFDDGKVGYTHFELFLHTDGLGWSDPAMRGRCAADWQAETASLPAEAMLNRLAFAGFEGLLINVKWNEHGEKQLVDQVGKLTNVTPLYDEHCRYFFPMGAYVTQLKSRFTGEQWKQECARAVPACTMRWGPQFTLEEKGAQTFDRGAWRGCNTYDADIFLENHTNQSINTTTQLKILPTADARRLVVSGDILSQPLELPEEGDQLNLVLKLTPGVHRLTIHCDGSPPRYRSGPFLFRVGKFHMAIVTPMTDE